MSGFDSSPRGRYTNLGVAVLVVILLGTSAYSLSGLARERRRSQDLTASNQALSASLQQVQSQLRSVSEQLNAIAVQPAPASAPPPRVRVRPAVRTASVPKLVARVADDPRWKQMQARLDGQQSKLDSQQNEIDTAREETTQVRKDLEDNLNATRTDLNGSIAKTHDELVALEKRGERDYHEFQLDKSKQFHNVGPIALSLRKANRKQGYYDLALIVDDRKLEKKHVNLYEPLMFTPDDRPQPVEVVVNQIDNNQVKGYVSEPKYKKSELDAAAPPTPPAAADAKTLQRR